MRYVAVLGVVPRSYVAVLLCQLPPALATRDSVKCRTLFKSPKYQSFWGERFYLSRDQNQKTYYETTVGGIDWQRVLVGMPRASTWIVSLLMTRTMWKIADTQRRAGEDWWDLTMSTRGVSRRFVA